MIVAIADKESTLDKIWRVALQFGYGGLAEWNEDDFMDASRGDDRVFITVTDDEGKVLGFWAIINRGNMVGEVHTCLSKEVRGELGVNLGIDATCVAFSKLGLRRITSYCPGDNKASLIYALKVGFKVDCKDEGGMSVSITRDEWYRKHGRSGEVFLALGKNFHDQLFGQLDKDLHPPDKNHDAAVGFTWLLAINGYPLEAEKFFNEWGAQFGYWPIKFLGATPSGALIATIGTHTILATGLNSIKIIS